MTETATAGAEPSASATITLFYLLFPVLILYFVYWKLQRRRFVELAEKIPGPTGNPIIGHGEFLLGSPLRKFHLGGLQRKWGNEKLVFFIRNVILAGFRRFAVQGILSSLKFYSSQPLQSLRKFTVPTRMNCLSLISSRQQGGDPLNQSCALFYSWKQATHILI